MGATLVIKDDVCWMPTWGTLASALEGIARELEGIDDELSGEMLEWVATNQQYYGLGSLDARRFQAVYEAMERAYARMVADGPGALKRPEFYPLFLHMESLFKALLRTDPRTGQDASVTGSIAIREADVWTAPAWMYDLVLEHLAADVEAIDASLSEALLAARVSDGGGYCDLRPLDSERFRDLLGAVEYMISRYQRTRGAAHAPSFFAEFDPQLAQLRALLDADPRAAQNRLVPSAGKGFSAGKEEEARGDRL